jgi:hypothetical protein
MIEVLTCECAAYHLDDYCCGKPDCPRVRATEAMLADIHACLVVEKIMPTSTDAVPRCRWCGQPMHQGTCPMISAIEYHSNGVIRRVEFWPTKLGDSSIIPKCSRCGGGHSVVTCPLTMADFRVKPSY